MDESINVRKEPLNKDGFDIFVSDNHIFGTDAILLASFCSAKRSDSAVDLGTGCGIIPFLLLRDGLCKRVYGVDISKEAIFLAEKTAESLKLEDKFFPILSNIKDLKGKIDFGCHTLVICNPPYFKDGHALKSKGESDKIARHETECEFSDIVKTASKLLQTAGRFCICQRPERLVELLSVLKNSSLEPKKLRFVHQRENKEPFLVLIESKKGAKEGVRVMPPLIIESNGELTPEIREIYGPYKEGR